LPRPEEWLEAASALKRDDVQSDLVRVAPRVIPIPAKAAALELRHRAREDLVDEERPAAAQALAPAVEAPAVIAHRVSRLPTTIAKRPFTISPFATWNILRHAHTYGQYWA
jgi:hypothetical protein